ncbi:unnamed protein product, partial [Mesorhabditis spiculigera]
MSILGWASSVGSGVAILTCLLYTPYLWGQIEEVRGTVARMSDHFQVKEMQIVEQLKLARKNVGRTRVARDAWEDWHRRNGHQQQNNGWEAFSNCFGKMAQPASYELQGLPAKEALPYPQAPVAYPQLQPEQIPAYPAAQQPAQYANQAVNPGDATVQYAYPAKDSAHNPPLPMDMSYQQYQASQPYAPAELYADEAQYCSPRYLPEPRNTVPYVKPRPRRSGCVQLLMFLALAAYMLSGFADCFVGWMAANDSPAAKMTAELSIVLWIISFIGLGQRQVIAIFPYMACQFVRLWLLVHLIEKEGKPAIEPMVIYSIGSALTACAWMFACDWKKPRH